MSPPAVVVHGGAGPIRAPERDSARREGCLRAARAGFAVLRAGGDALGAVVSAVQVLEDDETFNAGYGSVLNLEGDVEMDASLMEGTQRRAGAVAAVQGLKNPVLAARAVMEQSGHVLLVGRPAERWAARHGVASVPAEQMVSPLARARWHADGAAGKPSSTGTVGACAVDAQGRVAAATSTGGTSRKLPGRVGDTPLIGCGTYADDQTGAASATGEGELIIRAVLTKHACDALRAGLAVEAAAQNAIAELARLGGSGGVILVDRHGRWGWAYNTERMSRAWVCPEGEGADA